MIGFSEAMSKRDRCNKKAEKYLGCGFHLLRAGSDGYAGDLENFKKLFASGDPDLLTAAWNGIWFDNAEQIERSDFTDEEYEFVLKRTERRIWDNTRPKNPAKDITTERLILRANGDEKTRKLFIGHLIDDGDYEIYSDHEFRKIDEYQAKDWPFKFWIYEKESGNFVGTAGVHSIDEERKCADADWYILKPYRGRGYGKEAFLAVAKNLFDGKLPEYKALARYNTYRRYYPKINLIKAYIQEDNAPSRALAESCGFRHAYTDTRYFYLEDSKQIKNAAVYELAP